MLRFGLGMAVRQAPTRRWILHTFYDISRAAMRASAAVAATGDVGIDVRCSRNTATGRSPARFLEVGTAMNQAAAAR
ncbi:hypothetical protein DID97_32530 [Burkholderia sp. Bp8977]|nr:hypothetical protein DID97_32530 [Burkholderia sp. Bp8977]